MEIEHGALLYSQGGDIFLAENVYIGPYALLYGTGGLTIGRNSGIGAHSTIVPSMHIYEARDTPFRQQGLSEKGITIGDDVWVGVNSVILDGVTLGTGCIVAAGSTVTKSVAPFDIVGGVPAKKIGVRGSA